MEWTFLSPSWTRRSGPGHVPGHRAGWETLRKKPVRVAPGSSGARRPTKTPVASTAPDGEDPVFNAPGKQTSGSGQHVTPTTHVRGVEAHPRPGRPTASGRGRQGSALRVRPAATKVPPNRFPRRGQGRVAVDGSRKRAADRAQGRPAELRGCSCPADGLPVRARFGRGSVAGNRLIEKSFTTGWRFSLVPG